jgi:hypothetical protein
VCGIEFRTLNAPSRRQHFIYLFMARVSLLHFDDGDDHHDCDHDDGDDRRDCDCELLWLEPTPIAD